VPVPAHLIRSLDNTDPVRLWYVKHGNSKLTSGANIMQLLIKRICVPTDFSEAADYAVHYAAALAQNHNAVLHLLHVLEHAGPLVHHPDFTGDGEVARAYFNQLGQAVAAAEQKLSAADDQREHEIPELIKSLEAIRSCQPVLVDEPGSSPGHPLWPCGQGDQSLRKNSQHRLGRDGDSRTLEAGQHAVGQCHRAGRTQLPVPGDRRSSSRASIRDRELTHAALIQRHHLSLRSFRPKNN
jgi:nucleotide-binding universal stress UspA family protein